MTPWGIRNRIKSALGMGAGSSKGSDPVHTLTLVLPSGKEATVQAEDRYTLVMASQMVETPIATGCPDGHCGTCVVDVLDATGLAPATDAESKILVEKGKPGQRLACHARVVGSGAKVRVGSVWTMDGTR